MMIFAALWCLPTTRAGGQTWAWTVTISEEWRDFTVTKCQLATNIVNWGITTTATEELQTGHHYETSAWLGWFINNKIIWLFLLGWSSIIWLLLGTNQNKPSLKITDCRVATRVQPSPSSPTFSLLAGSTVSMATQRSCSWTQQGRVSHQTSMRRTRSWDLQ